MEKGCGNQRKAEVKVELLACMYLILIPAKKFMKEINFGEHKCVFLKEVISKLL
jgi:hypothetical protein